MKGVGRGVGFAGNAVVVQRTAAVLIGDALVDLPVGHEIAFLQGGEVEAAESLAERGVGTVVRAPEARKEAAARLSGSRFVNGNPPRDARVSCGEARRGVKARGRTGRIEG